MDALRSIRIRTGVDYFERNADRMRYPKFRCQHLFVGSGVIGVGCKTVIGAPSRKVWNVLDRSWSGHLNGQFEDFWEGAPGGLISRFYVAHPFVSDYSPIGAAVGEHGRT